MFRTRSVAIGLGLLLAACGTGGGTPPSDEEVIGEFVTAMSRGDREAAFALLGDDAESHDDGSLRDHAVRRAYLDALPECEVDLDSVEAVGSDLIVTVRFGEREGEACPGWEVGDTAQWVMRVEDGRITRVP